MKTNQAKFWIVVFVALANFLWLELIGEFAKVWTGFEYPVWVYILCWLLGVVAILFVAILFYQFGGKNGARILLANVSVIFASLAFVELAGQVYYFVHPVYQQAHSVPDKQLGWRLAANSNFIFTGGKYSAEFSTPVSINSHGYRDKERTFEKPKNTVRIGMFGDSMVQALQVSLEKTAARIFEESLNATSNPSANPIRYEVLNFGVSNFGLGQVFLNWKYYASKFDLDYIFVFLAEYIMVRTVEYEQFELSIAKGQFQSNRPRFQFEDEPSALKRLRTARGKGSPEYYSQLEREQLMWDMPEGFDNWYAKSMLEWKEKTKLNKNKVERGFFITETLRYFKKNLDFFLKKKKFEIRLTHFGPLLDYSSFVNFKILQEFAKEASLPERHFVIVDAFRYFYRQDTLSSEIRDFCQHYHLGYVDLSSPLLELKKNGIAVRWKADSHFNEAGQRVFGETLFQWMKRHIK